MRRQALRTINACSSHGGFLRGFEADINATADRIYSNGNDFTLLKPAPRPSEKLGAYLQVV